MRRPRGDEGAYAILYALLLIVVVGVAATVVDLAALREDRRHSRLASDAAAVGGARALDPLAGGNPRKACEEAWVNVASNMRFTVPAVTRCTDFPVAFTSCPAVPIVASATAGDVSVAVTWPVLQNSPLLTEADVSGGGAVAQQVDPAVDGKATDACARLAVTVDQVHRTFLAGAFGISEATTSSTSVARALAVAGNPEAVAALNVLNETTCGAILTSGQGFVQVSSVGQRAGIVAVESSGRHTSGGVCPPQQPGPWVINGASNSAGAFIRADGPGGPGQGIIYSYALNAAPTGNPAQVFNPALVPPGGTLLRPRPTVLSKRSGDAPVRDVYDCANPCEAYPVAYVTRLRTRLQSGTPQPYEFAEAPYGSLAFQTLTSSFAPGFDCTIGINARVLVPAGNWFVNCPGGLRVQGLLVFAGGTIVTAGGVEASGCLAVNVPLSGAVSACPTVVAGDVSPAPTKGATLYVRSGSLTKGAQGSLLMPRTFVYLNAGSIGFGGGSGTVFWSNPRQTDPLCTSKECQASRFSKLSLWTESTADQSLGGQSSMTMRGVVFVPKAKFRYTGQPTQNQTNAQFWADTIDVGGQSGLTMAPDPTDAVATPTLGVVLIR